jgi:hypothetical protein
MTRASHSALFVALLATVAGGSAEGQTTVHFDNIGAEQGITVPGTREFTFMGSTWAGGVVATERILPLYASGSFSYEVGAGGATVSFDPPAFSATFFYVHGFGFTAGTATAFDGTGVGVDAGTSRAATRFADPANFLTLQGVAPFARIDFSGGVVDDFTFVTAAAEPTPTPTPPLPAQFVETLHTEEVRVHSWRPAGKRTACGGLRTPCAF